jgi:hypothetical protein
VTIGFVLNPVVPVWLFASAVAVLFAAWRILPVRSGPRPLRGASMVHVPAGSEDRSLVCTKGPRPRWIGAEESTEPLQVDFVSILCVPFTPIEITREELDSSAVRYDADPWKKTGGPLSTCEGWPGKKAAAPSATRPGSEEGE